MQNNNTGGSLLKIFAAVALAVLVIILCGSRSDFSPKSCVEIPAPADSADRFFSALSDGRYEDCDAMLYNYSSLGFVSDSDTPMGQALYALLRESYGYTVLTGNAASQLPPPSSTDVSATDAYAALLSEAESAVLQSTVSGKEAAQAVAFTHLDISLISDELHERATEIAYDYAYNSIDINNEETANKAVKEALDQLEGSITDYYRTEVFVINMKYVGGEWKIVLDDSLYRAILGNIA